MDAKDECKYWDSLCLEGESLKGVGWCKIKANIWEKRKEKRQSTGNGFAFSCAVHPTSWELAGAVPLWSKVFSHAGPGHLALQFSCFNCTCHKGKSEAKVQLLHPLDTQGLTQTTKQKCMYSICTYLVNTVCWKSLCQGCLNRLSYHYTTLPPQVRRGLEADTLSGTQRWGAVSSGTQTQVTGKRFTALAQKSGQIGKK